MVGFVSRLSSPREALRALFSPVACGIIVGGAALTMLCADVAVSNTLEAQRLIGLAMLVSLPWIITGLIHACGLTMDEEGGPATYVNPAVSTTNLTETTTKK